MLVGGGKRALPETNVRVNLELLDERCFSNGTVYLRYRAGVSSAYGSSGKARARRGR